MQKDATRDEESEIWEVILTQTDMDGLQMTSQLLCKLDSRGSTTHMLVLS